MKRIYLICLLFAAGVVVAVHAQAERNLLVTIGNEISDAELLAKEYNPYPAYEDRAYWNEIPQPMREACIKAGESSLKYVIPAVPLTMYLEYKRTGSRADSEMYYRTRRDGLRNLILAELVEGKGRFIDPIMNIVWSYCEMTTWSNSAHLAYQAKGIGVPDIDDPIMELVSGEIGNVLAWAHYFFAKEFDKVSPMIDQRLTQELNRRIVVPYLNNPYWWKGFSDRLVNNWNPWCNFNALTVTMLACNDTDKRIAAVRLSMRSVDKFINYYKEDGACEEGPSYWESAAGKMMEYLELLKHVTGGKVNILTTPLVKEMGLYILNAHLGDDYYLNFADASAVFKAMPADVVFRYGMNTNSKKLMEFGAYLMKQDQNIITGILDGMLAKMTLYEQMQNTPANPHFAKSFVYKQTEVVGARTKADTNNGFFFGAKGGHNNESHNHNDVGTYVLYYNNDPVIIDAGVGTYTAKTFSKERYDIWTMRSDYHNLPIINGLTQMQGKDYRSSGFTTQDKGEHFYFSLDLANAYPAEAGVRSWIRSYDLNRNTGLTITDDFELKRTESKTQWIVMVAGGAKEISPGKLQLMGKKESLILHYNSSIWSYKIEELRQDDIRLQNIWGNTVYRVILTAKKLGKSGKYKFVISK